jgi:hypothetical protein
MLNNFEARVFIKYLTLILLNLPIVFHQKQIRMYNTPAGHADIHNQS